MVQSIINVKSLRENPNKVIGLKQTLRAIQQDNVKAVYIANDLDEHVIRKITEPCNEKKIPLLMVNLSKKEFGKLCQIEVGAAVVALLK
ncbi:MAG TPA: ribosomal L7Ae/L30e/S12e/Gadd45 family protein [Bacillota bacterium]|jgi:large subunit ribosomal protein L7A|nr:ribosomal L7Ae/L30e/S12e/Gadd45 family protein [Bacillota bacterium]HOL08956.1 ribosomal L7Ae/L30e/S12e/Gadd45 family protein [Bacillota bacterium]HPO96490.1 ribosomal L7Ae/L30e/S12e/Gadd45 family protein [Bacillota bacterium]